MAESKHVPLKKCMGQISMHEYELWYVLELYEDVFTWMINYFEKLSKNVEYWSRGDENWTFTVTKRNSYYSVTINTDYDGKITCSVNYDEDACSTPINADRIGESLYKVDFPRKVVNAPQNTFLPYGTRIFDFKWNERFGVTSINCRQKPMKDACRDGCKSHFYSNLSDLSMRRPFWDFVIHARGKSYRAHKSVLAARSRYFSQYIFEHCRNVEIGQIGFDVTYRVIDFILCFMYTGRMPVPRSKSEFQQIIQFSLFLGISKIHMLAQRYFWNKANNMEEDKPDI